MINEIQGMGWWDKYKFGKFLNRLEQRKKEALWEGVIDNYYFESRQKEQLIYDDSKDRKLLESENYKPKGSQDTVKMAEAENNIAAAKAVKQAYRKNVDFMEDIKTYLDCLKTIKADLAREVTEHKEDEQT